MDATDPSLPVSELRVAVTTAEYERLVQFYCAGLGIEPAAVFHNGQGHGLVLELGRATLEIFDEAQAEAIDDLEGRPAGEWTRSALPCLYLTFRLPCKGCWRTARGSSTNRC